MNVFSQRATALEQYGYTRREAEFLVKAALHSGYFVRRQFAPQRGKLADEFYRKFLAYGHVEVVETVGQTHIYHLGHKPFFRSLGQEDNRHRRKHESIYIRGKLMLLDYVLAHPALEFLPTEEEKVEYFGVMLGLGHEVLPAKVYTGREKQRTTRYFIEKYPVAIDREKGSVIFGFVDDGAGSPPSFRAWLEHYQRLIRAVSKAEVIYITARQNQFADVSAAREFERVFGAKDGIGGPVLSYFQLRRAAEEKGLTGWSQASLNNYKNWSRQYSDRRFEEQYSRWKSGAAARPSVPPSVVLQTHFLAHDYGFLGSALCR